MTGAAPSRPASTAVRAAGAGHRRRGLPLRGRVGVLQGGRGAQVRERLPVWEADRVAPVRCRRPRPEPKPGSSPAAATSTRVRTRRGSRRVTSGGNDARGSRGEGDQLDGRESPARRSGGAGSTVSTRASTSVGVVRRRTDTRWRTRLGKRASTWAMAAFTAG